MHRNLTVAPFFHVQSRHVAWYIQTGEFGGIRRRGASFYLQDEDLSSCT